MATARSKIIIAVVGSEREERFNTKARFGPVWLAAGRVRISGAPSLFLRFSTEPVTAMLSPGDIARRHLDEASMTARIRIEPPSPDNRGSAVIEESYIALKKSEGTYSFGSGGVVMENPGDCERYALKLRWPKRAPPATYQVRVYEVRDGSIAREASVPVSVVRTGFPAWIAELAENRASLYGVAAVLIGALAGFGIDFITTRVFGRKRRATR
jgi:hypothetical protein